jgi:hypothetical protein
VDASESLISGDWLNFPIEPEKWGTVISHMAFSNHFLFHHFYRNGQPEAYARQYRNILNGLKPGGSFFYSPGLPFIEALLPRNEFTIYRRQVIAEQPGYLYSVQILRALHIDR